MAIINQNNIMENMKEITGFDGYYISNDGKVWTTKKSYRLNAKEGDWREVQPAYNKSGYLYSNIYSNNRKDSRSSIRIHRLVWQEWVGCIPEGYAVDHKNGDKRDNRLENLQLLTYKQNCVKYHTIDKFNKKPQTI